MKRATKMKIFYYLVTFLYRWVNQFERNDIVIRHECVSVEPEKWIWKEYRIIELYRDAYLDVIDDSDPVPMRMKFERSDCKLKKKFFKDPEYHCPREEDKGWRSFGGGFLLNTKTAEFLKIGSKK